MSSKNIHHSLSFLTIISILLVSIDYCSCISALESANASFADSSSSAIATWYGDPYGVGSVGGACGFGSDIVNAPYYGFISAGNPNIYKGGQGCGSCYQVRCTQNPQCSGTPVTVAITDECPGCTDAAYHFDLSGKAFGALAKPGQADALRGAGKIQIAFQRVPCSYRASITFKIDLGSNPFYLAFCIEYVNGDGDIGAVQLFPSNKPGLAMQRSFGSTWKAQLPGGAKGPFSVKITTVESRQSVTAQNAIPANWAPGKYYVSNVNIRN